MIIRSPILFILLLFTSYSLAYPPFVYQTKTGFDSEKDNIEYAPFTQEKKIKTNTTTTTVIKLTNDSPICTFDDIPSDYIRKKDNPLKASLLYISNSILTSIIDSLKPTISILKQNTLSTHSFMKAESARLKNNLKDHIKKRFTLYIPEGISNSNILSSFNMDHFYMNYIQPIKIFFQTVTSKAQNTVWSWMDDMDDIKETINQKIEDIYLSPALEWHLFLNKVNRKWMSFCRYLGIDSHVRHLHRELFKSPKLTPHYHLDDIFKDMLETEYHSQFYQQQMATYFQSLSPEELIQVQYSKRDFIQWVKDGELIWHEFVDQMQHEWIISMQSLYQQFENIIHCLFTSPPTTMNKITCSLKNGRGLSLYTSPTKQIYQQQREQAKQLQKKNNHLHLHFWQHELLTMSKELEKTAQCICSHTHDSTISNNNNNNNNNIDHHHGNTKMKTTTTTVIHQQTPFLLKKEKITSQEQQQISKHMPKNHLFLNKHPIQELIDTLTQLQKEKSKQFTRLDKHLQRTLFEVTPPRSHQPIHLFYERLRDDVSARNKSTFYKYLTQLLYSWNFIISNTLDITTTMMDDLIWLQEKQLLEKLSSSSSLNHNQQQQEEEYKKSLELIWASSKRKLEKNSIQLVQQWESIFINMDLEIQEAWDNMLAMVHSSHRSSFAKVKQFWGENKSRLSKFFSNIFYSNTMDPID